MSNVVLTLENKAQKNAANAADFLTGKSENLAVFKNAASIAQSVQFMGAAAEAMADEGERLKGGVKAIALVAALVASKTATVDGKALDTWAKVAGWLNGNGAMLSPKQDAHETAMSEVGKVWKSITFSPAIPDMATTIEEAFKLVRDGLATHGNFKAWRNAAPKSSNAGRKAGKGAGKSTKAKAKAEPMTAKSGLKLARDTQRLLMSLAMRDAKGEAADGIRQLLAQLTADVATLDKLATQAPKAVNAKPRKKAA
jgi:hypothetical protein